MWHSRYGDLTSLRFGAGEARRPDAAAFSTALRQALSPAAMSVSILRVREQALAASAGATDFGEYLTYFSFFIVVSALLLVVLFFKLGVEQRLRRDRHPACLRLHDGGRSAA